MLRPYDGPPRLIVGYDGSPDAQRALTDATKIALARGAEIVLLNAVDDTILNSAWGVVFDADTIKSAATDLLTSAAADAVALGLPAERILTAVELGNPAAALARHSEAASLIVVGRRSTPDGERAYVGSTAAGVVGTAVCPVIVVSADHPEMAETPQLLGVGVNTAAKGTVALEWALRQGERSGAKVVVISVARASVGRLMRPATVTPEVQAELLEVTKGRIADMVAPIAAEHAGVSVDLEIEYGVPLDVLVTRSAQLDLLVVEVQPSFPTYSIGGLTRGLLAHSACPVATLRWRDSHDS